MKEPADLGDGSKTKRRIVRLLKTEGPLDAGTLAERIGVSAMAIRQHLYLLQDQKMVTAKERPVPMGRPSILFCSRLIEHAAAKEASNAGGDTD